MPDERFESFWRLVADALEPDGRVFFIDDGYRTREELIYGGSSSVVRRLNDGTFYRVVKVPYESRPLEKRLQGLGWRVTVTSTSGPFFWGAGAREMQKLGLLESSDSHRRVLAVLSDRLLGPGR